MILGGAVAGQGDISLPLILAITWLAAFLGDSVSFMLGRGSAAASSSATARGCGSPRSA